LVVLGTARVRRSLTEDEEAALRSEPQLRTRLGPRKWTTGRVAELVRFVRVRRRLPCKDASAETERQLFAYLAALRSAHVRQSLTGDEKAALRSEPQLRTRLGPRKRTTGRVAELVHFVRVRRQFSCKDASAATERQLFAYLVALGSAHVRRSLTEDKEAALRSQPKLRTRLGPRKRITGRVAELVRFVRTKGRLPSKNSAASKERQLFAYLVVLGTARVRRSLTLDAEAALRAVKLLRTKLGPRKRVDGHEQ